MTFAREWAQLRQDAQAGVNLNHAASPDSSGGAAGDLQSSKASWNKAASGVGELSGKIDKAVTALEEGQRGLGKSTGCLTAAAQREVYDSWQRYVGDVKKRCTDLQGVMQKVGTEQLMTDEAVKGELDKLQARYKDTAEIGGSTKGR